MAVSNLKPLAKPTNKDLDARIIEVHECVDKGMAKVSAEGKRREKALKNRICAVDDKVEGVKGEVDLLKRLVIGVAGTVGAPTTAPSHDAETPTKSHRRFGSLKTWQAFAVMAGGTGGALTLFRIIDELTKPWLPRAVAYIWHVLTTIH